MYINENSLTLHMSLCCVTLKPSARKIFFSVRNSIFEIVLRNKCNLIPYCNGESGRR